MTVYGFDSEARLINRVGNCCGYKNSYSYDIKNNITVVATLMDTKTTNNEWIKVNVLSEMIDQATLRDTYDSLYNEVSSITDKNGKIKPALFYDQKGNLVEKIFPLNISFKIRS